MSRKVKNVVMLAIILMVCVLSYFTMSGAVKSSMPNNNDFRSNLGGTLPNFNNSEFSEEEMPQRPSQDFENGEIPNNGELLENFKNGEMPNMGELPENFEKGEMPEGFEENFKNGNLLREQFKPSISAIYYILFVTEGLIISSLLIYLIMSKFNSKTLKETLDSSKKILVYIILVLIITIGLTVVQSMLAKNVFTANNNIQFENIQRPNNYNNINNTNETNEVENI